MKQYKVAVIPARMQMFTKAHEQLIIEAGKLADLVIVALGSTNVASSIKNPFDYDFRSDVIYHWSNEYGKLGSGLCINIPDTPELSDWVYSLKINASLSYEEQMGYDAPNSNEIILVGSSKDNDGTMRGEWAEKLGWDCHNVEPFKNEYGELLNATDIRKSYFRRPSFGTEYISWHKMVPVSCIGIYEDFMKTDSYARLREEYAEIEHNKSKYGTGPHLTGDALIFKLSETPKVLLITRGGKVGNGLLAMPGGYLDPGETFNETIIRECKEEINVDLSKQVVKHQRILDNPSRDLRGRIISVANVYYMSESHANEMEFKAGDDALSYGWYKLEDIKENACFADHYHVIVDEYFKLLGRK